MPRHHRLPNRLRVVVVDADHRVRDSLAELLGLGDGVEVVGRAGQSGAALALCADLRPDVVLVDPRLPDVEGGRALLADLRARIPGAAVLVLSWPGSPIERMATESGADGVLPKSAPPQELVARVVALARAAAARVPADRAAADPMLDSQPARPALPVTTAGRSAAPEGTSTQGE